MSVTAQAYRGAAHLWGELDRVLRSIRGGDSAIGGEAVEPIAISGSGDEGVASLNAIHSLRDSLGLTGFEIDVLLLCAGKALNGVLDPSSGEEQQQHPAPGEPTFRLALERLDSPHWSVLSRARPLRLWRLIEIGPGPLLDAPLRIDERVLNYLLEIPTLDERLDGFCRPLPSPAGAPAVTDVANEALIRPALQHWRGASRGREALYLLGGTTGERASLFRQLCEAAGLLAWEMRAADIPEAPAERDRLARAWTREAVLAPAALLLRISDCDEAHKLEATLGPWLECLDAPVALDSATESTGLRFSGLRLTLPALTLDTRKQLWQTYLGPLASSFTGHLDSMCEAYPLDREQVRLAAELLREQVDPGQAESAPALAWQLCREQSRRPLDQLALRIESHATWDDLVLPEAQTDILHQIAVHASEAAVVNGDWGFSGRYSLGLGLSALLAGASGTGKTMAAGILARSLDRDLYQIDLSTVVSKYIGDTEKHLRRIFDAAEQSGAILLFDEADALFGTRSQVKDSHDRYANLEISYLLQRMESYSGIALLTTNMQHAIDPAFIRRLRFIVQFPMPGREDRSRIWRGIFPPAAPVGDLDFDRLAQLNVTGGVIRNIAFHSAFFAAGEHKPIDMSHILRAVRTEYGKMERPLSAAETRGWE